MKGSDVTAKFEKGVSMTVDEVADVVGPEFKQMNENPPPSVVKVMEGMQGRTAAKRETHLENPKKPGFNLCGERTHQETIADGPRNTTCFYCKQEWERTHGGHMASERLSIDMFADILKDSKFEKGKSVPLSDLPDELQDNVNDPPPSVKKLTDELKNKQASGVLAMDMFAEALKEGKFEEGKPADPTENMSDDDAAEWERQNEEHKDEFKGASTPAQRSDDENNAVVENFFHKSAAQPQGAAQKAIMEYLSSHEPAEYTLTDMARTMRGMHMKSIMSAAQALNKNGLVTFDGVNISAKASKTADMSDLWVGWIEDPEGYMARFFAPTPRGAVKRQVMKAVNDVGVDLDWTVMQAGKALKTNLDPDSVSPTWFSKLPSDDKGALRAFLDMAPGRTASPKLVWKVNKVLGSQYAETPIGAYMIHSEGWNYEIRLDNKPIGFVEQSPMSADPSAPARKWVEAHYAKALRGKTAAAGLYGFTKATEGACGAGVNKLQKAAKKIAASLYAKDESSPSFLTKHAGKGGSKTASMLLKAMESLGPLAQINKTAGKSGTGLYGFSEKTAKLGLAACNELHHEAGVIAGDLFARKGADPVKVSSYLASHAKKAKCPYAALLGECAPDAPTVTAKEAAKKPVKPDTDFVVEEDDGIWSLLGKPSKFVYSTHGSEAEAEKARGEWLDAIPAQKSKKKATDFLASNEDEELEGDEEVLDIVTKC